MQLHLVRHPRPLVDQRYCYGSSDVAVAPDILASCCACLTPRLPRGVSIYSSPLQRCADLASALARELGAGPVILEAALQEMHFGSWELCAWEDIAWTEVEAWNRDLLHHAPGGGETLLAVAHRVRGLFDAIRRSGEAQCIVVCHGGPIRMLRSCAAWQAVQGAYAQPDAQALTDIALQAAELPAPGFGEIVTLDISAFPTRAA